MPLSRKQRARLHRLHASGGLQGTIMLLPGPDHGIRAIDTSGADYRIDRSGAATDQRRPSR